jgi:hypothetical protein
VRLHNVVADALCRLSLLSFIETTRANQFPYKMFAATTVNSINAANALINVDKAIFVAHLRVDLHCGEYVRLGNGVVGRLLDTHEENGEKMIRVHHYSIAPPDDGLLGGNCITNMEERVADNILSWESANSIEDIFFVFRASTIVTKRYSPNGIENAAFVRFFRRVSGALESLAEQTEEPFLDDPYCSPLALLARSYGALTEDTQLEFSNDRFLPELLPSGTVEYNTKIFTGGRNLLPIVSPSSTGILRAAQRKR